MTRWSDIKFIHLTFVHVLKIVVNDKPPSATAVYNLPLNAVFVT